MALWSGLPTRSKSLAPSRARRTSASGSRSRDGKFTICRFDQDDGHYQLLNGMLESADGPYTFGTYLWARFNNLTKWERKLIDGPYIHHMAEVEGDYTWELREFCRLIPHLDSDTVD